MAERSVFMSKDVYPFFEEVGVQFHYFQGFALCQKRKNQIGLHENFLEYYPERKVLEISSASLYSLGAARKHTGKTLTAPQNYRKIEKRKR